MTEREVKKLIDDGAWPGQFGPSSTPEQKDIHAVSKEMGDRLHELRMAQKRFPDDVAAFVESYIALCQQHGFAFSYDGGYLACEVTVLSADEMKMDGFQDGIQLAVK